jgi:hypothetical protein
MLRSLCLLIGLGVIAASAAFPDFIDVTAVNGSVSGSGDLQFVCSLGTSGCVQIPPAPPLFTVPYSFNGTNTELGLFSASGSADSFPWSIQGHASQDTGITSEATSEVLSIALTGGYSVTAPFYSASENDEIAVSFYVNQESVVLVGGSLLGSASNVGELLDSDGNVILTLPLDSSPLSTVVQPGMYQLDASAGAGAFGSFGDDLNVTNLELYLSADVTPTPEPRWTVFAALLATMLGGYGVSRWRCAL